MPQAPDKVRVKGFTVSNNPQIKLNPPQRKHIIFGGSLSTSMVGQVQPDLTIMVTKMHRASQPVAQVRRGKAWQGTNRPLLISASRDRLLTSGSLVRRSLTESEWLGFKVPALLSLFGFTRRLLIKNGRLLHLHQGTDLQILPVNSTSLVSES